MKEYLVLSRDCYSKDIHAAWLDAKELERWLDIQAREQEAGNRRLVFVDDVGLLQDGYRMDRQMGEGVKYVAAMIVRGQMVVPEPEQVVTKWRV